MILFCQVTEKEFLVGTFANLGTSTVKYRFAIKNSSASTNESFSHMNFGLRLGLQRLGAKGRGWGMRYEWQKNDIADSFRFSEKNIEQHLTWYFASETGRYSLKNWNQVVRVGMGYSEMRTRIIHPFYLDYSTPYDYSAVWRGFHSFLELGAGRSIGRECSYIQITGSVHQGNLYENRTWRIIDGTTHDTSGSMHSFLFGINITYLFRIMKEQAEEKTL